MRVFTAVVFTLLFFASNAQETELQRRLRTGGSAYLVTTPNVYTSNSENVCIQFFERVFDSPPEVNVQLKTPTTDKTLFETKKTLTSLSECLPVSLKDVITDRVILQVLIGNAINETRVVNVRRRASFNLIETSKNSYEPGDEIEFRVFSFNQWLKPVEEDFNAIWVEDSTFTSVMQWNNVVNSNGLLSYKLQLSEDCNDGQWKISALSKNNQLIQKTITVGRVVKPRIKIDVKHPNYILISDEEIAVNTCIENEIGHPLKGELDVDIGYRRPLTQIIDHGLPSVTNSTTLSNDGCIELKINRTVLRWNEIVSNTNIRSLRLFFEFMESETGFTETRGIDIPIAELPLRLAFPSPSMVYHYFKPGLPYFSYMLAEKPDFSPAPDEECQMCYETRVVPWIRTEESVCQTVKSDANGIVPIVIPATHKNISQIYLRVTSVNNPEVINLVSLESWWANSYVSMEVKPLLEPVCKGPLKVEVYVSNDTRSEQSIYYQIIGANSLQAPVNVKLQMQPWTPPISGANIDQEETAPLPEIKRGVLSIELPSSMPPYSLANRLVLYFLDKNGKVISDSTTFFVDCLNEPNVKMNIKSGRNSEIEVKIDDESKDSSCVVDISSNEKRKEITKRRIMHLLEAFDVFKHIDKCQQAKIALMTGRNAPYVHNSATSTNLPQNPFPTPVLDFHNSWDSFNDIGLLVASNRALDDSPCESDVFPRGFPPDVLNEFQHHSRIMGLRFTKAGLNAAALHRLEREVIDDMLHTSLLDSSEKKFSMNSENSKNIYGNAICLSKNHGMRFVDNKLDTSSAPVDLIISAPPKTIFGEEIPVDLYVEVRGKRCAAVQATVENSNLFVVNAIPAPRCVCSGDVLKATLKPKAIGRLAFQVTVNPAAASLCSSGQPVTFTSISTKSAVLVSPPGVQHKEYNTTLYCSQNKQSFSLKKSPSIKKATISSDIISLIHVNLKDHHSNPSVVDLLANVYLSSIVANTPHLKVTESLKHLINKEAAKSYQELLSYRYRDGSFTLSRRKHLHSYLSLTAEAFKTLTQLRKSNIKVVQDGDLRRTVDWIYRHQERDGCFYQQLTLANVWPVTLDSTLQTTAFVTASLIESGFNATSTDPKYPLTSAYQCIKSQLLLGKYSDLSLALLAYIESLRNDNAEANKRITELLSHATDSGDELSWNSENNREIAGYAILTLLKLNENEKAKKIGRWLVRQPKPLQSSVTSAALIEVWPLFAEGSNLKVKVNNKDAVALNGGESQNILTSAGNTDVQLEGTGCALLLLDTVEKFSDEKKTFFNMTVSGLNNGFSSCRKRLMRLCVKETGKQRFNASVIKVNYATGFTVDDRELLPRLVVRHVVSDFKIQQNYLLLYLRPFYNAPEPECFDIPFIQTHVVQNSRPAFIEAYDYYEYRSSLNHFSDVLKYSFPKECNVTKEMSHTKRLHSPDGSIGIISRRVGDEHRDPMEPRVFRCPEGVKESCPDCRSARHHYKNEICKSSLSAVVDRSRRITNHGHFMTYGHPSHRRSDTKKCVAVPLEIRKLVHLKQEGRRLVYHSEILHFFMLEECKCEFVKAQSKGEGLVVVNNLENEFSGNVNLLQLTEKDFLVNLQLGETKFPKCV